MQKTKGISLLSLAELEAQRLLNAKHAHLQGMVASEGGLQKLIQLRLLEFWIMVEVGADDQCWKWLGATINPFKKGDLRYGKAQLFGKTTTASRAAYLWTHGAIPSNQLVCHTCDNPICVNPGHLFLGDSKANMADCVSKGRAIRNPRMGDDHPSSILTEVEVVAMRELRKAGWGLKELAEKFGTKKANVHVITSGKSWKHILNNHGLGTVPSSI